MIARCQDSLHAFQGTRFQALFSGTYAWSSQSARKVPGLPSVCTANTNLLCVILDWLKYIHCILLPEFGKENVILAAHPSCLDYRFTIDTGLP